MTAFYNEMDPYAAQWLENLIAAGHIAPGVVDRRPIQQIEVWELAGFTQCHFFAGVGVWSHALRRAGWSDDRPIWTGSCPCQPFSAAGQQKGFNDERHLWPVWFDLIRQCRPATVLGEQVASALDWLDLVSTDLEGAGYAFGASDLCAAGFGGAHIRQRLYFVALADANGSGQSGTSRSRSTQDIGIAECGGTGGVANSKSHGDDGALRSHERKEISQVVGRGCNGGVADANGSGQSGTSRSRSTQDIGIAECGGTGGMADADRDGCSERERHDQTTRHGDTSPATRDNGNTHAPLLGRNPADWLYCRDGKWRPVEPGTFPLADEITNRVGRLRAYGNALDAETASQFCGAVKEVLDGVRPVEEFDL